MTTGPTPQQIATLVTMLRRHAPETRVIGIYTPGTWLGGADLQVDGQILPVAFCTSTLHVRQALAEQASDGTPLVLLTNIDDSQLGGDVLARLSRRRLYRIDRWQMVCDLFHAHDLDPRLTAQGWMADALLQHVPEGGYPPVSSGVLDADTVWAHLLQQHLALPTGWPDAVALLHWSLSPPRVQRYRALTDEVQAGVRQRVATTAGPLGAALIDTITAGHGELLLPIGLACEVLYADDDGAAIALAQARTRLEPYIGGEPLAPGVARGWQDAAATVLAEVEAADTQPWLDRTQRLLQDLKAAPLSHLSQVLTAGFSQRLSRFAEALQETLRDRLSLQQLAESYDVVCHHAQATVQPSRLERVTMALRLVRYLHMPQEDTQRATLAHAARRYAEQEAFVDWARRVLHAGDEVAELAMAYGQLTERVRQRREDGNRQFATLLAQWHTRPQATADLIPMEQAMSQVIANVAGVAPLLLVVIDGMSYAVFHQLDADLRQQGWLSLTNRPGHALPTLMSVLPSVTEMSRASLFAGKLTRGTSRLEKRHFAAQPALQAASRRGHQPVLFHKGELMEAGATGLAETVRNAIRDDKQHVVGVVLNAVDDHLFKTDQLRLAWTLQQFQHLDTLLYEAQLARRAVILTSDHGHILEAHTTPLVGGGEARWRAFNHEPLAAEEIVLDGPRITQVTGAPRIIVPWSETVRYTHKQQGYHGGATPQEVLVPLRMYTRDWLPDGWEPLPDLKPAWWEHLALPSGAVSAVSAPAPRGSVPLDHAQRSLFDLPADWAEQVLQSTVFAAQRRLAGRSAPDNKVVKVFLQALDAHHNRIPRPLLAQALGQPELRMRGLLAGLQRLFNVDGYPIVMVDDTAGTVELHRQLLDKQFPSTS